MVRVDIRVSLPIFTIKCDASCGFFTDALDQAAGVFLCCEFGGCFRHERMLDSNDNVSVVGSSEVVDRFWCALSCRTVWK